MKTKRCPNCEQVKVLYKFYKDRTKKGGLCTQCKSCRRKYIKGYLANNKQEYSSAGDYKKQLKFKFNLTLDQYDKMFEDQNGVCAIYDGINANGRRLAVDHCHKTGKIRGLLCHGCNVGIGMLKDDVDIVRKALYYLKRK